jgi:hypothetical protein
MDCAITAGCSHDRIAGAGGTAGEFGGMTGRLGRLKIGSIAQAILKPLQPLPRTSPRGEGIKNHAPAQGVVVRPVLASRVAKKTWKH